MVATKKPDSLRIGTLEREAAVAALGDHLGAGRLDLEEYEERMRSASAAKTRGELIRLFEDLPGPLPEPLRDAPPPPPPPPPTPVVLNPAPPPARFEEEFSPKSKVVAGVLQIVPGFGIGRIYTGRVALGLAQLVTVPLFGLGVLWCWIDGIILLAYGGRDREGRRLRE
ncbi:TM2 domain-containing protein [Actinoalloteichus cyanogriseus DSM 43889]|uniref:TM2 domain-containing protein n=1 Tax=Actinoalloteichus caeruleus DSM 43889 TaxID=1120930 RepID=A0ABT1JGD5_ACTCY|nr:TM2 domain-containing protein [Actinoalloteichus caeruleus DSM 43889]